MHGETEASPRSSKFAGYLFLLAAFLFILPSVFSNGNSGLVAIGIVFLIFGIVFLNKKSSVREE